MGNPNFPNLQRHSLELPQGTTVRKESWVPHLETHPRELRCSSASGESHSSLLRVSPRESPRYVSVSREIWDSPVRDAPWRISEECLCKQGKAGVPNLETWPGDCLGCVSAAGNPCFVSKEHTAYCLAGLGPCLMWYCRQCMSHPVKFTPAQLICFIGSCQFIAKVLPALPLRKSFLCIVLVISLQRQDALLKYNFHFLAKGSPVKHQPLLHTSPAEHLLSYAARPAA